MIFAENLHNLGDLALLLQCAEGLRDHVGIQRLFVRQWNDPPRDVALQLEAAGIMVIRGKTLPGIIATLRRSLLVMSGGQVARDNAGLAALVNLVLLIYGARIAGSRFAVLACGIDRLKSRRHRAIWRAILRAATLVTVRDGASRAEVRHLSPRADPVVTADLMFLPSALHARLRAKAGPRHVVVAPCLDASEGRSIDPARLAAVASQACGMAGVARVCLVAQDARPEMDMAIIPAIAAAIRARRPDLAVTIVASHMLDDALGAYAASALTITNRLHPAIFSLIAGRPILIVDDRTPKLAMTVKRFELDRIPVGADRIPADIAARLGDQMVHGPSPRHRKLLAEAKAAATANFEMMAGALGMARPPAPPDRRSGRDLPAAA